MFHLETDSLLKAANITRLVDRARGGDTTALCELLSRYGPQLRGSAFSILKNMDDAEDAVQEASIRVFKKIHTFDGRSAFSTWLTRIVINCCLMQLRHKRSHASCSFEELSNGDLTWHPLLIDSRPTPEEECSRRELNAKVRRALHALPETLQSAARDQIMHGLAASESAERRGISIPAAKSQRFRARKLLKRSLARDLNLLSASPGSPARSTSPSFL